MILRIQHCCVGDPLITKSYETNQTKFLQIIPSWIAQILKTLLNNTNLATFQKSKFLKLSINL